MSNNNRVIIIDDEPDIIDLVEYNLRKDGFITDSAQNGREALKKLRKERFDIIILDLMLPEIDGLELCRIFKKDHSLSGIPIIMLTAKGEEIDKVLGLELGADDYITKPFSPREMVARVKAVLRRSGLKRDEDGSRQPILRIGDLEIDTERYSVKKNGQPLSLSVREFQLLLYLAQRRGRIFSRDSLLDAVWGDEACVEPRTVDVHIRRLRTQIEDTPSKPIYIKTRRGIGYYVDEDL